MERGEGRGRTVGSGELGRSVGVVDTDHSDVFDERTSEEKSFERRRRDLKSLDFDLHIIVSALHTSPYDDTKRRLTNSLSLRNYDSVCAKKRRVEDLPIGDVVVAILINVSDITSSEPSTVRVGEERFGIRFGSIEVTEHDRCSFAGRQYSVQCRGKGKRRTGSLDPVFSFFTRYDIQSSLSNHSESSQFDRHEERTTSAPRGRQSSIVTWEATVQSNPLSDSRSDTN